jgi:hypothetical protein
MEMAEEKKKWAVTKEVGVEREMAYPLYLALRGGRLSSHTVFVPWARSYKKCLVSSL